MSGGIREGGMSVIQSVAQRFSGFNPGGEIGWRAGYVSALISAVETQHQGIDIPRSPSYVRPYRAQRKGRRLLVGL
ncbi:MAG: hypothetical protein O2856_11530 [Planctomycetota bacterium]|nr:hypothetical protein [Planctomycetota bacterium]